MTATARVMKLLAAGVPLSLLCDLADERGPESAAILLDEPPEGARAAARRAAYLDLTAPHRSAASA
jgi:hypothetical protein